MKRVFRKISAAVTAAAIMFTSIFVFGVPETAVQAAGEISGTFGSRNKGTWTYDTTTKTLTVGGSIAIPPSNWDNANNCSTAPWKDYINDITKVVIGKDIPQIGDANFKGCVNLQTVEFESGTKITDIGNSAFSGCTKLSNIILPETITKIGSSTFYNCTSLTQIEIPDGTQLGGGAFQNCTSLETVTFAGDIGLNLIVSQCFQNCAKLKNITIPNSVTRIGGKAFEGCTDINLFVPNTVTAILDGAFKDCVKIFYPSDRADAIPDSCGAKSLIKCIPDGNDYKLEITPCGGYTGSIDLPSQINGKTIVSANYKSLSNKITHEGNCRYDSHCTEQYKCAICGKECSHTWNSGTVTKTATCTSSGVKTYTCTVCGAKKTEDIAATGHSTTHTAFKAATCTADGNKEYWHCSNCNKNFTTQSCTTEITDTIIKRTGHSITHTEAKAATCTEDGNKEYWYCSECDKYFNDSACIMEITKESTVVSKTGHLFSMAWAADDTYHWHQCAHSGCDAISGKATHSGGTATCQTQATCFLCGQKYGSLGAHSYGTNWVTSGTQHWHKCTVSGCTSVQDTADHTFVQKSDGTSHWQECSVCGYKKDEAAHSWGNWTLTAEPTLTAAGTAERACSCGEKQTVTVPELTDTTVWTKDDTQHIDATEDEDGKDVYTSTDYGSVTVILPALGHTHIWGDWTIKANPTLTSTGTAQRICTKNNTHTDTKTLPVLTDTSVWTKTQHVDPTEKAEGKDVYTSEYGDVTVPIEKLPHTHVLTHVDEVPPTAEKEGVKEHWHCDGCGKDFLDKDGNGEATAEDLRIGKIQAEVQAPANFPKPTISTPKEEIISIVLTQEEQEKVKEGMNIKIILKVEDASHSAPAEDKAKIETAVEGLEDYKLGQYLDVTLLKKIGDEQKAVTSTSKPITVTFEIPENLRGMAKYSVIRVHGGETTVLEDEDSDPDTVTIETDKFSTYALTYQPKAAATEPNGGNGESVPTITPVQNGNYDTTSSESDTSGTAVSTGNESDQAPSGENSASGKDDTGNRDGNPSTGAAVPLVSFIAALSAVAAASKLKKK